MGTKVFYDVIMGGLSATALCVPRPMNDGGEVSSVGFAGERARLSPPPPPVRTSSPDLTPTPFIGVSIGTLASFRQHLRVGSASPERAVASFRQAFREMRGAVDVENHLSSEAELFHTWQDRLDFLQGAFKVIMSAAVRFSIAERAHMIHSLAGLCEEMDVMKASDAECVRLIGMMREFQFAMDGVEKAQLMEGRPARAMALQVADMHFAYARKSEYLRFLMHRGASGEFRRELRLASTVLRLRDVLRRYGLVHDDVGIASVFGFLKQLREEGVLPGNDVEWAINRIQMFMERHAAAWQKLRKVRRENASTAQQQRFFRIFLADLTRGLYLYSPILMSFGERIMREAGVKDMASEFKVKADAHRERARKLGLL